MTNHEKYRNASSIIEPSAEFATKVLKEAEKIKSKNSVKRTHIFRGKRRLATLAASLALVFCLATVSYATDFAGFKKNVDSWLYGSATKVKVEQISEYEFKLTYPDGNVRGTGGAVDDGKGKMRAATPEEIIEQLNQEVEVEKNGKGQIMLYYRDHVVNITDKLDKDNIAKVKFNDGVLATYLTIRWNGDGSYVTDLGHFGYKSIKKDKKDK